jgi:DNA-binding XRE family transcriptional regulator
MAVYLLLENVRKAKMISQVGLASMVRHRFGTPVTQKTISRWENGTFLPRLDVIYDVAEVLGVKIDDILRRKEDEEVPVGEDDVQGGSAAEED